MYKNVREGKFRRVLVSPEIAISQEFGTAVLSKRNFQKRLRSFVVDEAHCICEWGGSFREDYTKIGALRGRVGRAIPFLIASATLPDHVLGVVKEELQLASDAVVISLSNERKNIALSTRVMKFDKESKADLRFSVPNGTSQPTDIPITLIYVNTRIECEDICEAVSSFLPEGMPEDTVSFYHSKIGRDRKRELEDKLRTGDVRILVCTDAVGMVSNLI